MQLNSRGEHAGASLRKQSAEELPGRRGRLEIQRWQLAVRSGVPGVVWAALFPDEPGSVKTSLPGDGSKFAKSFMSDGKNGAKTSEDLANQPLFQGAGCETCSHTGFRGRAGIYEFLPVSDQIKPLILERASAGAIKESGVQQGMRTLRDDGWRSVREGTTTVAEVVRVTQDEV
jgi:hypothetical protein